jgi:hypothetical protein
MKAILGIGCSMAVLFAIALGPIGWLFLGVSLGGGFIIGVALGLFK